MQLIAFALKTLTATEEVKEYRAGEESGELRAYHSTNIMVFFWISRIQEWVCPFDSPNKTLFFSMEKRGRIGMGLIFFKIIWFLPNIF
jgi:hypothetical protein